MEHRRTMKKTIHLGPLACLSAILIFAGCRSGNLRPTAELAQTTPAGVAYVAKPGDTLMVKVWGEPQLTGEVFIREDGRFTLPLIEDVQAENKNLKEITEDVTKRLQEFVPAASVTISVAQAAPIRYFLSGQFIKPGEYRSDNKITFLQAIATGGGFAPFADESSIILIRRGPQGDMRYELDYNRVVEGKEPNPELKDGDTIAIK
jgi:polysaccharide biosynthesis/export protein